MPFPSRIKSLNEITKYDSVLIINIRATEKSKLPIEFLFIIANLNHRVLWLMLYGAHHLYSMALHIPASTSKNFINNGSYNLKVMNRRCT